MPGEHKVHPYLHLETLCRGSVNILYSPLYWIPMFFAILGRPPSKMGESERKGLLFSLVLLFFKNELVLYNFSSIE